MADENTITTYFRADISNFSASTQQLNRYVKTVNSEFANATASMGKWSDNTDGLKAKLTQLNGVLQAEKSKLGDLTSQYERLQAEGKGNTKEAQNLAIAINNQSAKVKSVQKDINKYTANLKELEDAGVDTTEQLKKMNDETEKSGDGLSKLGGVAGGVAKGLAGVAVAVAGAVTGFLALAESTRETRTVMGQVESAFNSVGFSAEQAESSYVEFNAVLGDTKKTTETIQQLSAFAKTEQDLTNYTHILTGVYAKFGDSIATEGLAEGINHTIQLGTVQGQLADALEWSGVSVDDFNAQLATCNSEQERNELITKTLNGLYGDIADKYKETNADIIEAEEAQSRLNLALADLGAIAEPIMTTLKLLAVDLLQSITPFVALIGDGLTGAFEGSAEASKDFADGLNGIISLLIDKVNTLLPTIIDMVLELIPTLVSTVLNALPTLVTTILSLVSQIIVALSEMLPNIINEILKVIPLIIDALMNALPTLIQAIFTLITAIVQALPTIIETLLGSLEQIINSIINGIIDALPMLVQAVMTLVYAIIGAVPTIIKLLVKELPKIINNIISNLLNRIPDIIQAAIQLFMGIVQAIPVVISEIVRNMPQIISSIVKGLGDGVKQIFNVGVNLVKGLWDGIKSMFSWIGDKIKGFGKSIVDGFKNVFGIHSPSTLFRDQIGTNLALGIGEGFEDTMGKVNKEMAKSIDTPTLSMVGSVGSSRIGTNNISDQLASMGATTNNKTVNNIINNKFEKMATSKLALHKANLETKRLIGVGGN